MKLIKLLRAIPAWIKSKQIPCGILAVLCPFTPIHAAPAASPPAAARAGVRLNVLPAAAGGQGRAQVDSEEVDKTLTTRFTDGWFVEENSPTGPFRWMSVEGRIDVTTRRQGTLVIRLHTRSYVTDNSLEVFVDGKSVQSIKLAGVAWQDCLVRVPLTAGTHHLSLRSRQPGGQPPGDSRTLTVCVENFQATLEP